MCRAEAGRAARVREGGAGQSRVWQIVCSERVKLGVGVPGSLVGVFRGCVPVRRWFPEDFAAVTRSAKRRTGIVLVVAGALMCLAGAVLYVMPGPGFPVLVLGLAAVVFGLFLLAALRRE